MEAIKRSQSALNKSILISSQQGNDISDMSFLTAIADSIEPENLGRIAGNFSPASEVTSKTSLFDGDEIVIPKSANIINVIGEVLNPIAFEFTGQISLDSAIERAGGLQDYADAKRIFVIKANGLIESQEEAFSLETRILKLEIL